MRRAQLARPGNQPFDEHWHNGANAEIQQYTHSSPESGEDAGGAMGTGAESRYRWGRVPPSFCSTGKRWNST